MISIQQVKPFTNEKYAASKNLQKEKGRRSLVDIISSGTKKVWDKKVPNTQMEQLKSIIQDKYGVKFDSYWDFHDWSIKNYAQFWEEMWNFYGVIHSHPYSEPAVRTGDRIIDIKWFPGAMLNYAENLLRHRDEQVALICVDEEGAEEQITYAQMYEEVKLYAAAFKKHGLQKGDRLACYMSNRKEAVFAMLAATSIGAIFGGPLPFYGGKAVATIMQIMKPKFLLTADCFTFNRVNHNILDNLPEIASSNEEIEKVIIVPTRKDSRSKEINHITNAVFLEEFLECGRQPNGEVPDLEFEQFPFDHPIYINFTSGTTGLPKGLVHSAGTFLAVLRDYGIHCDLKRGDVILHMQPVGWNLWNLGVNFLAMGGTLLVYDGLPTFLSKTGFWDIMDQYKVAFAFLPTSIIDTLEKEDMVPGPDCKLEHLKILSIGASPVKLQNIDFILQKVKPDVLAGCLYGATEVIGVFSGFDLNSPVYSSEIQCPALGVDLRIFDNEGNSVVGKTGELVIATPTLSMPISVWGDEGDAKMQENYLSKFPGIDNITLTLAQSAYSVLPYIQRPYIPPEWLKFFLQTGVWTQNDEAWVDPATKGIIIIGRSDNTIKQHGERFVSEEIYWALHGIEEIADTICVGQYNANGDGRAVLFVKMKNGYAFDAGILKKIETTILQELTVFYIPQVILPVKDIPYNLNGKKMESLVKKIINTNTIPQVNNVRNPECLTEYCNLPQLYF